MRCFTTSGFSLHSLSLLFVGVMTASCGSSQGTGSPTGLLPVTPPTVAVPRYAYTANVGDNSVSTYVVDASTGRLTFIGKVAAGIGPFSVTVDPSGKYAYVTNRTDWVTPGTISQYTIGTNGALTPIAAAATIPTGIGPCFVTVDPSGKYAYVVDHGDGVSTSTISQFTIGIDGALTPNDVSATVATGVGPNSITFDPSGKYAYVTNYGDGVNASTVSQYTLGANGVLAPNTHALTTATGVAPRSITFDPFGKYAYVANNGNGIIASTVSQYTLGANGVLTLNSSAEAVAAGIGPYSIVVDPAGKYAYVANYGDGVIASSVSQYTIEANGVLKPNSETPTVAAGVAPCNVKVDPSGKYVYVSNRGDSTISQYTIGSNGALAPLSPATVATAAAPTIAISAGTTAVKAVPQYAYVTNSGDGTTASTVSQYLIQADGSLKLHPAGATFAAGVAPFFVTTDPTGKYAYVANYGNGTAASTVSLYSVGTDGAISPNAALSVVAPATIPTVAAGIAPFSIAVDPSGKYAYVANIGDTLNPSTVSQYTVDANGGLTPNTNAVTVAAGVSPQTVTIDPSGKYAYVVNRGDDIAAGNVSQYTIGTNGTLSSNPLGATAAAGVGPRSIAIDPSGKFAYVTNRGTPPSTSTVTQYTIGATGALSLNTAAPTVAAGVHPYSVTVHPSGKYAYVTNAGDGTTPSTVSQYTIGTNGALTLNAVAATVAAGVAPISIKVDPSGQYAYVVNYNGGTNASTVSQYTINADGTLKPMLTAETVASGVGSRQIFISNTWQ